ncbi:protealysin inhibitor emfourin [Nocardia seriolae]|uniref:Uncharacterized protein n=1 Tax=Nocardia seriolae TaxID=37332 RepID=A0ABC9YM74_9NOCA|nr:protealysin inhibitor emfourin [Nocardia seriolae]APA99363.1 hypothetical protein NS506_05317 [Nocardia seriolae]OJF81046.1 hypothetical protein NS14008_19910 [Nocardia seriolae]PSK31223.1 hypothetical protein C6575_11315 [Nocardia seriolae]QOW34979.1 hypothetical protein IMZ23_08310 [Nocardia seriolae]QUN17555.1 hypothetical protein KEC46_36680 [Nocardia seriolae]
MSTNRIHVEYRRSGGLAGLDMTADVDVEDLPADQRRCVEALMTDARPASSGADGSADRFTYKIVISDGDRTWTHSWGETQVPEAVEPLLATLAERAHPAPSR